MDVLEELHINFDLISTISLDISLMSEYLEYAYYSLWIVFCGSTMLFPLLNGVLHTPPGYMLYGMDGFGYHVLIKAINGKVTYYERSQHHNTDIASGFIAWDAGRIIHENVFPDFALFNNDPTNYIRNITNRSIITNDCGVVDSLVKDSVGCFYCCSSHIGSCEMHPTLNCVKSKQPLRWSLFYRARFVRCEPAPIPKYYYHAENIDEVIANYDKIIDIPEPDYSYVKYLMPSV